MADEKDYEGGELEGQSFVNQALTGSGTITPDGTYADPLPDPTEQRGLGPRRTSGGRLVPDANDLAETDKVESSVALAEAPELPDAWGKRDGGDGDSAKSTKNTTDSPSTPAAAPAPKKATGTTAK